MKEKLTLFVACMFLSIGASLAQVTVKGTVISADDGEPLPGASVKLVGEKKGTVTVTKEAETVGEGVVVDRPPFPSHECRDQEDKSALRLVEIGHKDVHEA